MYNEPEQSAELTPAGSMTASPNPASMAETAKIFPLEGNIDLHVAPRISSDLADLLKPKPSRVIIDLSRVNYIDSSGLALLINAMRDVEDYGGIMMLADMPGTVRPIFETARLENFFLIFPTVDAALAAP